MTYTQRVRDNLLPLSSSGTLPEAFAEWSFAEQVVDHGEPNEECKLCDQQGLRYHFLIENDETGHTLWVGSECILRFEVAVFQDGVPLNKKQAKRKLDRLADEKRLESCLSALRAVSRQEGEVNLKRALEYYEKNGNLTPKQAFVVLWRLDANGVDHNPSFFKINLRKQRYKDDLRAMPASRIRFLWPALSSAQRKLALKLGVSDPTARS